MALFSKTPAKKPEAPKAEPKLRARPAGAKAASARDVLSQLAHRAAQPVADVATIDPSTSSGASASGAVAPATAPAAAPAKAAIDVQQPNLLCAAVENAALLFASNQAKAARQLLEDAVAQDAEARASPLAWDSLFDLLRRLGDRPVFDRLALQYVVQFERSAPSWEELGGPAVGHRVASAGAFVALSGRVTGASTPQLEPLARLATDAAAPARLDLGAVAGWDEAGARLLADSLAGVRRRRVPLAMERPEKLRQQLDAAVNQGREAGEGPWLLLLEMLQWQGEQARFDDRAVEYAVTFEMSPPSWEPPARAVPQPPKRAVRGRADADVLAWTDEVKGASPAAVAELLEFAKARAAVTLDMTQVERIDFVSGGALANAIQRLAVARKTVHVAGASPIVRALLLLVGIAPDLFVRKPA